MRLLKAAVVLAVLVVTTMIPAWSQDLVAVAPKAAKVVYEDARIRVVRLRIEPNEALPTHDRPRRVIIPLTTSGVNSTRPDGRTGPSRSSAGHAVWGEPWSSGRGNAGAAARKRRSRAGGVHAGR